ncbi:MAG: TldD/PmbA family protein [bacterium]
MNKVLEKALNYSKADETEVIFVSNSSGLTRFANSSIHQNVYEEDKYLKIRVIKDKKIGSVSTNILTDKSIKNAVNRAIELSKFAKEDSNLALPKPTLIKEMPTFYKDTANCSPERKANIVKEIIEMGKNKGCISSGALQTGNVSISISNSSGVDVSAQLTSASLVIVMEKDGSSGYSSSISRDINKINHLELGNEAIEKAISSINPKEIGPGEYEVILEPPAVADLLLFLGLVGFGALSFQEKRSFMCGNMGKKIMGENITIWDDGCDPQGTGMPFDFEGVSKEKVIFIENGIAKNICYDSYTANRENTLSTGHSLPQPNTTGPIPTNLFMKEGNSSKEEIIKNTKKGILITRFHYTNVIEPMRAVITGMTRDGTFFIENGKVSYPIKNMRFTQSIIDGLSNVSFISKERRLSSEGMIIEFLSSCYVPTIKIEKFNFTGKTDF